LSKRQSLASVATDSCQNLSDFFSFGILNFGNSGVHGKNNEYRIVDKLQNSYKNTLIVDLIDIVVFVVFALYSRISLHNGPKLRFSQKCQIQIFAKLSYFKFEIYMISLSVELSRNTKMDLTQFWRFWNFNGATWDIEKLPRLKF
jgi:hypothetical protein